jgi:hypothetical protein
MPELKNTTDRPISASTGHTVPAEGSLGVSNDTYMRMLDDRYFALQISKGRIIVSADEAAAEPEPEPERIAREDIAKMKRSELLDLILVHYGDDITEDDFEGITVEDKDGADGLRTIATRLVFSDL